MAIDDFVCPMANDKCPDLKGENLMLRLDEIEVYRRTMAIGEKAWKINDH